MRDLEAGVAAVRSLHRRITVPLQSGKTFDCCEHCTDTGDPYCVVSDEWPCPTIRALGGEATDA
jgi:hypothetical protein